MGSIYCRTDGPKYVTSEGLGSSLSSGSLPVSFLKSGIFPARIWAADFLESLLLHASLCALEIIRLLTLGFLIISTWLVDELEVDSITADAVLGGWQLAGVIFLQQQYREKTEIYSAPAEKQTLKPQFTDCWDLVSTLQIKSSIAKKVPVPAQPWCVWSENPRDEEATQSLGMKNHCHTPGGDQSTTGLWGVREAIYTNKPQSGILEHPQRAALDATSWMERADPRAGRKPTASSVCLKHNTSFNA